MAFTKIANESDLPGINEATEFQLGGKEICVANVNGTCSAMDNICLHQGGPLSQGVILEGKIVCPWHGWGWDPTTGKSVHVPNAKVGVYPLKIENGDVLIEI